MSIDTSLLHRPSEGADSQLISPFLELGPTGIKRLADSNSTASLLAFWFSVPEGALQGRPGWGHPFESRLFGVGGHDEIVVSQMLAVRKLRRDMPSVKITGISGEFTESDLLSLTVYYPGSQGVTAYTGKVQL